MRNYGLKHRHSITITRAQERMIYEQCEAPTSPCPTAAADALSAKAFWAVLALLAVGVLMIMALR
jgi:hypothetical protein